MTWLEVTLEFLTVFLKSAFVTFMAVFHYFFPKAHKCVREKVILVTGAGGGMGRLLAEKFAFLGAHIILVDVNKEQNIETLQILLKMKRTAYAYTYDVSDENQVHELADEVRRNVGHVDIVINNAGVLPGKRFFKLTPAQIRRTMAINVLAHFWLIQEFLPPMLDKGEGHIVAISSLAGILGSSYLADYCASKYGVIGLMAALREELYEMGVEKQIKLTVICPGTINTGLIQRPKTRFPSLFPILDPEETANIIVSSVLREKLLVVIPPLAHIIFKIAHLFPAEVSLMLQRFMGYSLEPNLK